MDLMIDLLVQNQGKLSKAKKATYFSDLPDETVEGIEEAFEDVFQAPEGLSKCCQWVRTLLQTREVLKPLFGLRPGFRLRHPVKMIIKMFQYVSFI